MSYRNSDYKIFFLSNTYLLKKIFSIIQWCTIWCSFSMKKNLNFLPPRDSFLELCRATNNSRGTYDGFLTILNLNFPIVSAQ